MNRINDPKNNGGSLLAKKQLKSLQAQNKSLSELVIKLSRFYEGITPEVDKEMQVLRGHLSGRPDYTLAAISINKLNGLLMAHSDQIKQQSHHAISKMESAIKRLQQLNNLPGEVQHDTVKFLTEIDHRSPSIYAALPQFERAIDLYQRALENTRKQKTKNLDEASQAGPEQAKLHAAIAAELKELIEQFYQADKQNPQLQDIRQKLMVGLKPDQLLEACLLLLRLIVQEVASESDITRKFITKLHQSLVSINQQVEENLGGALSRQQERASNLESMKGQLQEMDAAVQQSASVDALKASASKHINILAQTIAEREAMDTAEQQALIAVLSSLRTELSRLEKEAEGYRNKLQSQHRESRRDPLTRIANRVAYNERMNIEFQRWKRQGGNLCVAVIDVDHFKNINDQYGHAAGDKTLSVIARHLQKTIRGSDFLARWGGEEFVLLLPDTSLEDVQIPLNNLRETVQRLPFKFKNQKVSITVSIGATCLRNSDTIESAFERADTNLYQSKTDGRNKVTVS